MSIFNMFSKSWKIRNTHDCNMASGKFPSKGLRAELCISGSVWKADFELLMLPIQQFICLCLLIHEQGFS